MVAAQLRWATRAVAAVSATAAASSTLIRGSTTRRTAATRATHVATITANPVASVDRYLPESRTLWGYRCDDGCGTCGEAACGCDAAPACGPSCGGCDSCVQHDASCGMEYESSCGIESLTEEGIPIADGHVVRVITEPTPAKSINPAKPGLRPYPQDIPRIFKARPQVAAGDGQFRRLLTARSPPTSSFKRSPDGVCPTHSTLQIFSAAVLEHAVCSLGKTGCARC